MNACKIIHQNVNRIWKHPHVDKIWNFQTITKMGIITTISYSIYFRMIIYVHTYIIIYTYLYILVYIYIYIYLYLMVYIVCLFSKQKEASLWFPVPWVPFLPQGPRARGCSGFPDLPFLAEGAVPEAHDQGGRRNPKGWYLGCSACGFDIIMSLSLSLSLSLFMYIIYAGSTFSDALHASFRSDLAETNKRGGRAGAFPRRIGPYICCTHLVHSQIARASLSACMVAEPSIGLGV